MVILYRFDNNSAIIESYSFEDLTQLENYNDVEYINCRTNLTVLPELPSGLKYLNCTGNQLTVLPELPPGLKTLHCSQNL